MKGKIVGGIGRSQMRKMGEREWKKGRMTNLNVLLEELIFLILPAKMPIANYHFGWSYFLPIHIYYSNTANKF
jgi:hypothetical protein